MEHEEKSFKALGSAGLVLGLVGVGTVVAGTLSQGAGKADFLHAYLFGWIFWVTLAFGFLGLSFLTHATKASWGNGILRLLEAGSSPLTFGVLGVLFVPIVLNYGDLYGWANPAIAAKSEMWQHRAFWMNPTAVTIRTYFFLGLWMYGAALMRKSSLSQEVSGNAREADNRSTLGAASLVVLVITGTFAFSDWSMSLAEHFSSTMWGGLSVVGGGLAAMSLCTFLTCSNADKEPFHSIVNPKFTKDLGNLMLVFSMLWGYFNFSQYLIIWSGNLPPTAEYYAARSQNGFYILGGLLILGQFAIPFLTLLIPRVKRVPKLLAMAAAWILVFRVLDIYNTIIPFFPDHGLLPKWQDFVALLGIGGFWFWSFGSQSGKTSLVQNFDNRLREAGHHA